ncbi:type I methionyl aminopeptidase [Dictyobacter arantiisoli]|uniref:Methionine aminopeptidase n=1 Tax=Dictyobacter arantiisoli TaxID=2014874 RepID=A0A5A5TIQ9_9CHLR|nr:type I methionyl aminopeptidase [Dictyobacter arantiisoli]GCF11490.1 methionine aminopeptidase [Dictyobacter arantiisoli]
MAVLLKSRKEVDNLREAGRLVAETFEVLRPYVKPGVSTDELDKIAEDYIRGKNAIPLYKGYGAHPGGHGRPAVPPFPGTICASVNEVICHGIPSTDKILQDGDIIGVDIGVLLNGWSGDSCMTYGVGNVSAEAQRLMDVTRKCMDLGIEQARHGNRLGDIGAAIQTYAEAQGFSVVRDLVGHGIGRSLHEDPNVPHYGRPHTGLRIQRGMVFTIEPMINIGTYETKTLPDRWTIVTADGKLSAQYEHSLAITDGAPEILTLV